MAKKGAVKRAERAAAFSKMSDEGLASVWTKDEAPFVRAILADRFDDAPRLIFADWLEERGDPRGEFIRVQCQLRTLRLRDPEYEQLDARSEKLIAKHRSAWLKPYPRLPATLWGIHSDHFRRGLPAAVSPKTLASFVNRAPLLIDTLGMTALKLYFNERREVEAAAKVPQLARIDELLLEGPGNVDPEPLWHAPWGPIWRLSVPSSSRLRAGLPAFLARENSPALRRLQFEYCNAEDLEPLLEWKHLDQLDQISVASGLPDAFFDLFANSSLRLSDYSYNVSNLALGEAQSRLASMAKAPLLSEVSHLHMDALPRTPELWRNLVAPPRVRWLSLVGLYGDSDVLALLESSAIEPLERLDLHGNFFMPGGAALAVARSEQMPHLRRLRLAVEPDFAAAVVELLDSRGLEHLTLSWGRSFSAEQKARLRKKFAGTLVFA